jgi:hypothetical protein
VRWTTGSLSLWDKQTARVLSSLILMLHHSYHISTEVDHTAPFWEHDTPCDLWHTYKCRFYRVLTMVYNTQNYRPFGLCP